MKKLAILLAFLLIANFQINLTKGEEVKNSKIRGVINITVNDAWNMLNSDEDGIQHPVDVRYFNEYFNERIATPHIYDKPILFTLQWMESPYLLNLFKTLFKGKEIILYCRTGNRSYIAGKMLEEAGFEGKIYNMMGGIVEWKNQGLPTVKGFGFKLGF
ncbi:MAG: rhodanese-like domain-containing protein [Thermoplasmatales archaeon]|nr:rhodanese-like domain-containing protein [Thermoplasmatales archaeon]